VRSAVLLSCRGCYSRDYGSAAQERIHCESLSGSTLNFLRIMSFLNAESLTTEDSFDNMKTFAARHSFVFPYVIDTTQEVARAYGPQCTPDFFGFNMKDELQYRGRLDASRTSLVANARRDLFEAMKQVAETGHGPEQQMPSMGCSIKWKH
jgi:hypothetical protein